MCLVAVEKDTEGKSMDRLKRLTTELVPICLLNNFNQVAQFLDTPSATPLPFHLF